MKTVLDYFIMDKEWKRILRDVKVIARKSAEVYHRLLDA